MQTSRRLRGARRRSRLGFTLWEVVLALAVLVALGAIVVPSLVRRRQRQALLQAAEMAREALTAARRNALERGVPFQLRYEPGGRRLVVLPDHDWLAMTMSGPTEATTQGRPSAPTASDLAADPVSATDPLADAMQAAEAFQLPEPFVLTAASTNTLNASNPPIERLPEDWFAHLPDASRLAEVEWSPAIRFFPDGQADAAVFAVSDGQRRVVLSVRSLTGQVRLSPIESTGD